MYLGFEILKLACPRILKRYQDRFDFLLDYYAEKNSSSNNLLTVREEKSEFHGLYLTLWEEGPSGKFIPLILDAMFHEFFSLHRVDGSTNELVKDNFCQERLSIFISQYFPDLDQESDSYRRLTRLCHNLLMEKKRPDSPLTKSEQNNLRPVLLKSLNNEFIQTLETLKKAARSNAPILLTGETGSGKEVMARFIHEQSLVNTGPFMVINCAGIPDALLESELFGYRKGAFSGAEKDKPGLVELSRNGTLFLDEIGEMPRPLQAKLLRFLGDSTFTPLGSVKVKRLDTRILAATNMNLKTAMANGNFRQDLYYRLNVFNLPVPPLRDRPEDIPDLVDYFIKKYNTENNRKVTGVTKPAFQSICSHDWPGNVRELENMIQKAVILTDGSKIEIEHLDLPLSQSLNIPAREKPNNLTQALRKEIKNIFGPKGKSGSGRGGLAESIPFEHIIDFFNEQGTNPFQPMLFADHISPPHWYKRRDKLTNNILRKMLKAGILSHNGGRAQKARYSLAPKFIKSGL